MVILDFLQNIVFQNICAFKVLRLLSDNFSHNSNHTYKAVEKEQKFRFHILRPYTTTILYVADKHHIRALFFKVQIFLKFWKYLNILYHVYEIYIVYQVSSFYSIYTKCT